MERKVHSHGNVFYCNNLISKLVQTNVNFGGATKLLRPQMTHYFLLILWKFTNLLRFAVLQFVILQSTSTGPTNSKFYELDVSLNTPTKYTLYMWYILLPYFSYMFRCISHQLQEEPNVFLTQNHLILQSIFREFAELIMKNTIVTVVLIIFIGKTTERCIRIWN